MARKFKNPKKLKYSVKQLFERRNLAIYDQRNDLVEHYEAAIKHKYEKNKNRLHIYGKRSMQIFNLFGWNTRGEDTRTFDSNSDSNYDWHTLDRNSPEWEKVARIAVNTVAGWNYEMEDIEEIQWRQHPTQSQIEYRVYFNNSELPADNIFSDREGINFASDEFVSSSIVGG